MCSGVAFDLKSDLQFEKFQACLCPIVDRTCSPMHFDNPSIVAGYIVLGMCDGCVCVCALFHS